MPVKAASEPIAAVATPAGVGGVGIVRISGDDLSSIARGILNTDLPSPRQASRRRFVDENGNTLDDGLCLYFTAPNSFTGQDMLELHGHGGSAIMRSILSRCLQLGARLATPGEFTMRAYLNGKIDLAQAEAVADVINASSSAAARAAVNSLSGAFSQRAQELTASLVLLRTDIETNMDFADEDTGADTSVTYRLKQLRLATEKFLTQCEQGAKFANGITVAIVGRPNVGKSSLLNYLCGEDAAIVAAVPGTTRDTIGRDIDINGMAVRLIDTAGLRTAPDDIEKEGIARAIRAAQHAEIVLLVSDNDTVDVLAEYYQQNEKQDGQQSEEFAATILQVRNKIDLIANGPDMHDNIIYVSAKTGAGMDDLRTAIINMSGIGDSTPSFTARARHVAALEECLQYLQFAEDSSPQTELVAAWLSSAHTALSSLTGVFDDEKLLGEIFSRFCIGK